MLCLFIFTSYNTKHNPPKNYEIYRQKQRFSIAMVFQNANENELHGFRNLVIWLWKNFGNISKGVFTTPLKFPDLPLH